MSRQLIPFAFALLSAIASAQESPVHVFQGANVITLDAEEILPGKTVVVADGRMASMGPEGSVAVPPDADVIDASGRFLMPGLTEMHGHVPGTDDLQYLEDVLFLYVANGVTTVRGEWFDRARIDAELAAIAARHR